MTLATRNAIPSVMSCIAIPVGRGVEEICFRSGLSKAVRLTANDVSQRYATGDEDELHTQSRFTSTAGTLPKILFEKRVTHSNIGSIALRPSSTGDTISTNLGAILSNPAN